MRHRAFFIVLIVLLGCGAFVPSWADSIPLKVGQVSGRTSLIVSDYSPGLIPVPAYRNEAFPSATPLPSQLAELPDIISALVGFHDNEIAALVDADLVEPLDPFFERLGVDPTSLLSPNLLAAVTYKGKIWALPHRASTYMFSYSRGPFHKGGVAPEFETWDALFGGLQKLAEDPATATTPTSIYFGRVPNEALFPLLMWWPGNVGPGWVATSPSFQELFDHYREKEVFALENADFEESMSRIETYSSLPSTKDRGVLPLPQRLSDQHPVGNNLGTLGFLDCFAVRKNSDEKLAAAEAFLGWLVSVDTQLRMVEASRIDYDPYRRKLGAVHVPLYRTAMEAEEFKKLVAQVPEYAYFLDFAANASFAQPQAERPADSALVRHRREKALEILSAGGGGLSGMLDAAMYMFSPRTEAEDAEILSKVTPESGAKGAFDEF